MKGRVFLIGCICGEEIGVRPLHEYASVEVAQQTCLCFLSQKEREGMYDDVLEILEEEKIAEEAERWSKRYEDRGEW